MEGQGRSTYKFRALVLNKGQTELLIDLEHTVSMHPVLAICMASVHLIIDL